MSWRGWCFSLVPCYGWLDLVIKPCEVEDLLNWYTTVEADAEESLGEELWKLRERLREADPVKEGADEHSKVSIDEHEQRISYVMITSAPNMLRSPSQQVVVRLGLVREDSKKSRRVSE